MKNAVEQTNAGRSLPHDSSPAIEAFQLLEANQNYTLLYIGTRDAVSRHSWLAAIDHLFCIGDREAFLTIESGQRTGIT